MKINPSAGFEQYKTYVQKLKKEEGNTIGATQRRGAEANTDKVTLSGGAAVRAEFSRVAAALGAEVEALGSAGRMGALKEAVDSGTYSVPAEALADAILGYEE